MFEFLIINHESFKSIVSYRFCRGLYCNCVHVVKNNTSSSPSVAYESLGNIWVPVGKNCIAIKQKYIHNCQVEEPGNIPQCLFQNQCWDHETCLKKIQVLFFCSFFFLHIVFFNRCRFKRREMRVITSNVVTPKMANVIRRGLVKNRYIFIFFAFAQLFIGFQRVCTQMCFKWSNMLSIKFLYTLPLLEYFQ